MAIGVKLSDIKLQFGTQNGYYVTWEFTGKSKSSYTKHTDKYEVKWYYQVSSNGVWFGPSTQTTTRQVSDVFTPEANALNIKVTVKPIAKKNKKKGKKKVAWYTGKVATKTKAVKQSVVAIPALSNITLDRLRLHAEVNNYQIAIPSAGSDVSIEFRLLKDDTYVSNTPLVKVVNEHAEYTWDSNGNQTTEGKDTVVPSAIEYGHSYKISCRAVQGSKPYYSDWSEWTEAYTTGAVTPTNLNVSVEKRTAEGFNIKATWDAVENAKREGGYTLQYADNLEAFDTGVGVEAITVNSTFATIGGLNGRTYYFRVRATSDGGDSEWSAPVSLNVGTKPQPPTIYSQRSMIFSGEKLPIYWIHNSTDGSIDRYANVELKCGDNTFGITLDLPEDYTEDNRQASFETRIVEVDGRNELQIRVSMGDGHGYTWYPVKGTVETEVLWRMQTKGAFDEFSDWSEYRVIYIYTKPSVDVLVTPAESKVFPIEIQATASRSEHHYPVSYYFYILAKSTYIGTNPDGTERVVSEGERLWFTQVESGNAVETVALMPTDVTFENDVDYEFRCVVSMSSGMTAENSAHLMIHIPDVTYDIGAYVSNTDYEEDGNVVCLIQPYCREIVAEEEEGEVPFEPSEGDDEELPVGQLVEGVTLSVYRQEFDGNFVKIAEGLPNKMTGITDPHPPLKTAVYRITATNVSTGEMDYEDVSWDINDVGAIIQWDESVTNNVSTGDSEDAYFDAVTWSGNSIRFLGNIDVSEDHNPDVVLAEYVGRKRPVSYYGTQVGQTTKWSMEFPKPNSVEGALREEAEATLKKLRELQVYMGDCYVREPSGLGYWANVKVSFNQKHLATSIPVSFDITRVEGGM